MRANRIDINGLWYNIQMNILMHMCCANCALYPAKTLTGRGDKVTGYWFNPNIEPLDEYNRRLGAMEELERRWALEVIYNDAYDNALYKKAVDESLANGGTRCEACYRLRLGQTAGRAKREGADAFTTSLLVSPYQRHELVKEAGLEAARKHGVEFYYEDFRPGWNEGRAISRDLGLYRQNYCGCAASKQEREAERTQRRAAKRAQGAVI